MDLSFQNETQISEIFRSKKQESQGLMGFREFVKEDSDAVISQIRKIRDQMRVIKLKRDLEREKDELQTLKQQKRGEGVMKHRYR
jgi:hypothetical protein